MSVHISAKKGEIAPIVLMPGDPLRARHLATNFLEKPELVSQTRNIFCYTGTYKGKSISVAASGMGCPSIGIYSYELYTEYEVATIVRIGTCGAYSTDLKLFDVLNTRLAASESTYAQFAWGFEEDHMMHQGATFELIKNTAVEHSIPIKECNIHSSDIFYRKDHNLPAIAEKHQCLAVEMEAFALFANARYMGKNAATLLTVSDVIPIHEVISADEREKALNPMIRLALESCLKF